MYLMWMRRRENRSTRYRRDVILTSLINESQWRRDLNTTPGSMETDRRE